MKALRIVAMVVGVVATPVAAGYALARWALDPWVDNKIARLVNGGTS